MRDQGLHMRDRRGENHMENRTNRKAQYYTAQQLRDLGADRIPSLYSVTSHLVYSSPATLAYNSPGAEGFGVKRAGLAVPDSVMLIISPPCCGRNTSQISSMPQYRNRFFYLEMDETDLVTGRHLKSIPEAVRRIVDGLEKKPSLVMLCATCVDALLGTDWDRVSRAAEEKTGVRVRPCYMYALTREGRRPPMVHVRQSLYSLLEKTKRRRGEVNLMGFFAPLSDESELYRYLRMAGVTAVRELSRCASFEEFQEMARAQFNLVLHPESRPAADDLSQRLGMPYAELGRFYDPDRIHRQYDAFFKVLGIGTGADGQAAAADQKDAAEQKAASEQKPAEEQHAAADPKSSARAQLPALERADYEETVCRVKAFFEKHPGLPIAIGETLNADPFELALALASQGAEIKEVYGTVTAEALPYISRLAELSPQTRFYCNQDPSMMFYRDGENEVDLALGKDAAHYHPHTRSVCWNEDRQPFGYAAVRGLYAAMEQALDAPSSEPASPEQSRTAQPVLNQQERNRSAQQVLNQPEQPAKSRSAQPEQVDAAGGSAACPSCGSRLCAADTGETGTPGKAVPGLRRHLTPFAPDQSGAVSVLYALGGMTVIVDAGGCAGNICGFDEPRWLQPGGAGAVFSAGLRDMDAILGRDDLLVRKLEEAAEKIAPEFIALVGTPVPAVIATDFQALRRMAEKKTSLDVLPIVTNGMDPYDKGVQDALLELMKTFAGRQDGGTVPSVGVLGCTPMDFRLPEDAQALKAALREQGYGEVLIYGVEGGLDAVRRAGSVSKNLVVSPAGMEAALYLEKEFGIPWETGCPLPQPQLAADPLTEQAKVLIVHQQILANAMRDQILGTGFAEKASMENAPQVHVFSWFRMLPELMREGDGKLDSEDAFAALVKDGGYDRIIADPVMKSIVPFYEGKWIDAVHFAVSGQAPHAE